MARPAGGTAQTGGEIKRCARSVLLRFHCFMTDSHSRRAESHSRPSHASDREKQTTHKLHIKMEDCNNSVKQANSVPQTGDFEIFFHPLWHRGCGEAVISLADIR